MTENYAEIHESYEAIAGWATIDYADSIGGYEWDQFRVMRGPDGLLYVATEGGCSCNYFGNDGPSGFVRVSSWQEAVKRLGEWEREYDFDKSRRPVAAELRSRLSRDRPRARIAHDPAKGFQP